jgi:hypothetical protein
MDVDAIIEELEEMTKYLDPDCIVCKAIDKLREQAAEIKRLKKIIEEF